MKVIKHGEAPNEIECYTCDYCGCKFEVPASERMTTFVLHKPDYWPCPDCGRKVFSRTRRKDFKSSGGGRF